MMTMLPMMMMMVMMMMMMMMMIMMMEIVITFARHWRVAEDPGDPEA